MRPRKWTMDQLAEASKTVTSIRGLLKKLGLVPAGGNYAQVKKYIQTSKIDISHFKGSAWNRGMTGTARPRIPLDVILTKESGYQSYKLKRRLFAAGMKKESCEECGWAQRAEGGHLPLELDHINGNRLDNRLENLRILCPNCHSLKPTHRGKNKKHG